MSTNSAFSTYVLQMEAKAKLSLIDLLSGKILNYSCIQLCYSVPLRRMSQYSNLLEHLVQKTDNKHPDKELLRTCAVKVAGNPAQLWCFFSHFADLINFYAEVRQKVSSSQARNFRFCSHMSFTRSTCNLKLSWKLYNKSTRTGRTFNKFQETTLNHHKNWNLNWKKSSFGNCCHCFLAIFCPLLMEAAVSIKQGLLNESLEAFHFDPYFIRHFLLPFFPTVSFSTNTKVWTHRTVNRNTTTWRENFNDQEEGVIHHEKWIMKLCYFENQTM